MQEICSSEVMLLCRYAVAAIRASSLKKRIFQLLALLDRFAVMM